MTTQQTAAFLAALELWMQREGLAQHYAASRLDISNIQLGQWLNRTRNPSAGEMTDVLGRIAGK